MQVEAREVDRGSVPGLVNAADGVFHVERGCGREAHALARRQESSCLHRRCGRLHGSTWNADEVRWLARSTRLAAPSSGAESRRHVPRGTRVELKRRVPWRPRHGTRGGRRTPRTPARSMWSSDGVEPPRAHGGGMAAAAAEDDGHSCVPRGTCWRWAVRCFTNSMHGRRARLPWRRLSQDADESCRRTPSATQSRDWCLGVFGLPGT